MRRSGIALGLCVLAILGLPACWLAGASARSGTATPAEQWIVVTAPAFRQAVEPLCEHRRAQGLKVVLVQTSEVLTPEAIRGGNAEKLRQHVNQLCRDHKGTSYLLLVGAVEDRGLANGEQKVLPPLPGTIGRMKGQPSDNGYGCLDDNRLPTVAIGRFPARTEEEARGMVAKTLAFERDQQPGRWRRRLTILAGIPAYNPVVDRLVETLALARFERLAPVWTGKVIYTNPQSPFCVPDGLLQARALQYVQEGEAFTVYLGHSNPEGLYGGGAHFLDRDDWGHLRIARGAGVFVTFGCNGCQLKGGAGQGYGVAAIRNPNGPVAVVGSHGICFAAMVQLAADGLFESSFTKRLPQRLGESWLAVKAGVARGTIDAFTYRLLDAVDGDRQIPQATQRQEHLEMFLLLGDPALRLPATPADIDLKTNKEIAPGDMLSVQGEVPAHLAGAHVKVTLERTVNSLPDDLEALPRDPLALALRDRIMLANHERANRFVLAEVDCVAKDVRFEAKVSIPAKLPWTRLVLRACAAAERAEGMGVKMLAVQKRP